MTFHPPGAVGVLVFLTLLVAPIAAQTWTACNPLNETTCPTNMALGMEYNFNFTQWTGSTNTTVWNTTAGTPDYGVNGAGFTVAKKLDSPTIQSNFYFFFGTVEVIMKAATGQGIISSIVLESDDLDEIDWEFMGGNTTHVETNYFGKGNTTSFDRAIYYPVDKPQDDFHNYTVVWAKDKLEWIIDGNSVRTLAYDDANGGKNFPQTPMNLRLGIWPAGDPKNPNGTIQWAGGPVDYSQGPYTMVVTSATVKDASSGATYAYGDTTGSWESIKVSGNQSTIAAVLTAPPSLTPTQRFNGLSSTARIAIIASVAAVVAILFGLCTCCCIRQRRAGKRERMVRDDEFEKSRAELLAYRADMDMQRGGGHKGGDWEGVGLNHQGGLDAGGRGWKGEPDWKGGKGYGPVATVREI